MASQYKSRYAGIRGSRIADTHFFGGVPPSGERFPRSPPMSLSRSLSGGVGYRLVIRGHGIFTNGLRQPPLDGCSEESGPPPYRPGFSAQGAIRFSLLRRRANLGDQDDSRRAKWPGEPETPAPTVWITSGMRGPCDSLPGPAYRQANGMLGSLSMSLSALRMPDDRTESAKAPSARMNKLFRKGATGAIAR